MPFLVGLLLILPLALLRAWCTVHLWHWFIVPQFGVTELPYKAAVGISILVAFLTQQHQYDKKDKGLAWDKLADMVAKGIFLPLTVTGIAWLFYAYM